MDYAKRIPCELFTLSCLRCLRFGRRQSFSRGLNAKSLEVLRVVGLMVILRSPSSDVNNVNKRYSLPSETCKNYCTRL